MLTAGDRVNRPLNQALATYVTSVAFHLTLTRPQMLRLCRLADNCLRHSCKCDINTFVVSSGALMNKGLFDQGGPHGYLRVTKAGELVHALMVEAGLCVHQWDEEES